MNTKLLKQKILDLAIRGKLTQQLKRDGTAKDLLTQISDERRETKDERKGTRSKKSCVILSEAQSAKSKDSGQIIPLDKSEAPFEIPANWEWVRLGDVAALKGGKRVPAGKTMTTEPTSHIYIRVTDMRDGTIYDDDLHYVTDEIYEVIKNYTISKNDLYITIAGTIGRVGLVPDLFDGMNLTENALKITNVIPDKKYLMYALQSGFVQDYFESTYHQVAMPKLSLTNASKALLPLPPLAEQRRIVEKIQEAFAEIDSIEKNKELLKTHIKQARQKILDLAIHGKLVPQNKADEPASVLLERITRDNPHYEKLTDIPFEIPESWEWVNAEDLFNIRSAIRIHQTDWQKEGIPFFRGRELVQLCKTGNVDFEIYISEKLYEENKRKGGVPQKNDILVSAVGTLGFAYVVKGNKPFYYKDAYILCFENRHNLNPFYFQHLIHSKFINKIIYGGSKGTTVDQLTIENAKKLPMPLPPLAEQKRIVDRIEEIFKSLDEISLHLV